MNLHTTLSITLLFTALLSNAQPAYSPAPPAPEKLTTIEWFIDRDPGFGQGHPLTFNNSSDESISIGLPLTGVTPGVHHFFARGKDALGRWSIITATTFENFHPAYTAPAAAPGTISRFEFFFDFDPGFGNGSIQSVAAGTDISDHTFTLNIDTLSLTHHNLFVRVPGSLSAVAGFSNDVPLPLTWLFVKGEMLDGQSHISWGTAAEQNTKSFEIQHGLDGHTFTTIGTTPAAGNSASPSTYAWIHTTPATGINYYRIRQVDLDNKFTYSKVIPLLYNASLTKTTALPNPTKNTLTLLLAAPAERSILTVLSATGQAVMTSQLEEGTRQQTLDLSALSSGIYFIRISNKNNTEMLRVVKE
jgi:hypothetical protein